MSPAPHITALILKDEKLYSNKTNKIISYKECQELNPCTVQCDAFQMAVISTHQLRHRVRTSQLRFCSLGSYLVNLCFAFLPFSPGRHKMERPPLKRRVQECVVPGLWSTCPSPPASMRRIGPSVRMMTG